MAWEQRDFRDFGVTVTLYYTEIQMLLAGEKRWESRLEGWVGNRLRKRIPMLMGEEQSQEQRTSRLFSEPRATWSFAALCAWDTTRLFVPELPGRKLLTSQSVKLVLVQENSGLFNSNLFQIKERSKQCPNGTPKPQTKVATQRWTRENRQTHCLAEDGGRRGTRETGCCCDFLVRLVSWRSQGCLGYGLIFVTYLVCKT